jgi:hypothetical protein
MERETGRIVTPTPYGRKARPMASMQVRPALAVAVPADAEMAESNDQMQPKKMRPRSDAATDGDRWGRVICDGGPDQTHAKTSPAMLRANDIRTYPQPG